MSLGREDGCIAMLMWGILKPWRNKESFVVLFIWQVMFCLKIVREQNFTNVNDK